MKIEINGVDMSVKQYSAAAATFTAKPPGTILASDYTNGRIESQNQVKYYYFPVDLRMKEAMFILNKTQIFGSGANGDVRIIANVINNTENVGDGNAEYANWVYPTD